MSCATLKRWLRRFPRCRRSAVPATVKARVRALAEQFDSLRTQRMKEALLVRVLHTRSRARYSAEVIAAAHAHTGTDRTTPPRPRTATPSVRVLAATRARWHHEHVILLHYSMPATVARAALLAPPVRLDF